MFGKIIISFCKQVLDFSTLLLLMVRGSVYIYWYIILYIYNLFKVITLMTTVLYSTHIDTDNIAKITIRKNVTINEWRDPSGRDKKTSSDQVMVIFRGDSWILRFHLISEDLLRVIQTRRKWYPSICFPASDIKLLVY